MAKVNSNPTNQPAKPAEAKTAEQAKPGSRFHEMLFDLVFMFTLVMFVKMFVVELYKIPTGSMTPTLIGGRITQMDLNHDKADDLIYWEDGLGPLVYLKQTTIGRYLYDPRETLRFRDGDRPYISESQVKPRYDRILVNKLAFWFRPPQRGEIVIFRVPQSIFRAEAPIYIKRCVGEPGEQLTFREDGRLMANQKAVEKPDFFATQSYVDEIRPGPGFFYQPEINYQDTSFGMKKLVSIQVPRDKAYVFGDNTHGSLDSRYWGGVPLDNFKGRAFFRLWPLSAFGRLR